MRVVERKGGGIERQIVISMIVSRYVLGKIAAVWESPGFLSSKWANLIAGWCVKYYTKYGKSPGPMIETLFRDWATSKNRDSETIEMVEKFLDHLNGEYKARKRDLNEEYIIDRAGEYFDKVRLEHVAEDLQDDLEEGDVTKARERMKTYAPVQIGVGKATSILADAGTLRKAFEQKREPLIEYPGAAGEFFRECLERDGFVSFEGPEKRGKSYILLDIAWRGMQQRRKVAMFQVGDMSESQVIRRFAIRAAKRPLKARTIKYPTSIVTDTGERGLPEVEHEDRTFEKPMSWRDAWRAFKKTRKVYKSKEELLRLSVHPNSSINVTGIREIIRGWEREQWTPDVVVIDYADILAPMDGRAETRDQINATWKALRGLSQELHCLVVTATQTDADSYTAETISMRNYSEDKRKRAHVTASFGINVKEEEKEIGVIRLNPIVMRDDYYRSTKCVYLAGCLDIANPCIKSSF